MHNIRSSVPPDLKSIINLSGCLKFYALYYRYLIVGKFDNLLRTLLYQYALQLHHAFGIASKIILYVLYFCTSHHTTATVAVV